ncbi:hypothetical protein HWV62_36306 [Athelia sp. TMB]|nr:hypothetical protein HWV62_36306 [Athelia sp. TMB]
MSEPLRSGTRSSHSADLEAEIHSPDAIADHEQRGLRETDTNVFAVPPAAASNIETASGRQANPIPDTGGHSRPSAPSPTSPTPRRDGATLLPTPPDGNRGSHTPAPGEVAPHSVRFENLEGRIPQDQLSRLRLFVSHHALSIDRLRIADANLNNLGGQLNEVREHASSLTRRLDRAMSDNNRFLLESDAQLAELGRMFDRPRTSGESASAPPMAVVPTAIIQETRSATAPVRYSEPRRDSPVSDDDLYEQGPDSINRSARQGQLHSTGPRPDDTANRSTRSVSSRTSLPGQQPNESDDQYDARYEANIRRVTRTQDSWARAFPSEAATMAHGTGPMRPPPPAGMDPRDVRFERPIHRANSDSASRMPGVRAMTNVPTPSMGLSAYRVTQGPVTNGLWNNDHYHYVVLLGKVTDLIIHKVGTPFEVPPGFKQPKLAEPPKYAGSHSHNEFMDWLSAFLNWLRGHYICGPATDPIRINYLGLYVEGVASDWYLSEVDNPTRRHDPPLLFADCVCLMHRRFVRTATANDAAIKFGQVRYSAKEGIEGLFYRLDTTADRMIERPNDYDFRRRFFNLLPPWLFTKLMDRNINPEYSSMDDLRENAKQLEENSMRPYEGVGEKTTAPSPRTATASKTARPADANRGSRNGGIVNDSTARPIASARPNAARTPATPRPPRPQRDTSGLTCFSCGKVGHISTEPVCDNYEVNRTRLHAQREMEGHPSEGEEDSPDNNGDLLGHVGDDNYAPTWGGSQYESDYESAAEENEVLVDAGDAPRMASMHSVRMAVMRVYTEPASDSDEMPALESCLDSDVAAPSMPRPPRATIRMTRALPTGHLIGMNYNSGDHYGSDATDSDNNLDEDESPSNDVIVPWLMAPIPLADRRFRTVMDASSSLSRLPTEYVDDRGPISAGYGTITTGTRSLVPSCTAHLPGDSNRVIMSGSLWADTQERELDFARSEDIMLYNRSIARQTACMICGGACVPSVFQALSRPERSEGAATYITTFACNFARVRTQPPEDTGNIDHEDHDWYSDAHGDYSEETMYAMRVSHSSNIRRATRPGEITRPRHNQETITVVIMINGHKALALLDSGSTTDSITPEFGFVSRTKQFKLDEQVTLQLGCVGSRSKISYGAVAPFGVFGITGEMYFDVVNIDRYDAILGTPFLKKHGVCLDFKNHGVTINGVFHKTFSVSEEIAFLAQKGEAKEARHKSRPAPRETAPIQPRMARSPVQDN